MGLKTARRTLEKVHGGLMCLFPGDFRAVFEDEMRALFAIVIAEAAGRGNRCLAVVGLRELRDMLVAAAQVRQMEKVALSLGSNGEHPLSRKEMLIALAVFLIPAGMIIFNAAPPVFMARWFPLASMALLLAGLFTGLLQRLPRWSLAYLGLVLSAAVFFYLFQGETGQIEAQLVARSGGLPGGELGRLLLSIFWQGIVWLSLLLFACGVYLLLALLPWFRSLIQRLEEDWTHLSYLLYSGSMIALLLAFDEYQFEEPFALAAVLALAFGAWGYLRVKSPRRRFLSLLAGITLAMWVVGVGKWLLVPRQEWANWFSTHPPERERWFEAGTALIGWIWMVFILVLPALLRQGVLLSGKLNGAWPRRA
jgi:hypothetical protein